MRAAPGPKSVTTEAPLLDVITAPQYLRDQGVFLPNRPVDVRELGGGVSNVVLSCRCDSHTVVLKQALPRLRASDEWVATRTRALTEAKALGLVGRITPDAVPGVLRVDDERCAIVIAAAPSGWRTWKDVLLDGGVRPGVGWRLGSLLGEWHRSTVTRDALGPEFDELQSFIQLRVDPYHRTVARRLPEVADRVNRYAEELLSDRHCLVHGDFSPKNVLVGDSGLWVIDFEVAHRGNPVFDLAFLVHHLVLKALHLPRLSVPLHGAANEFLGAYGVAIGGAVNVVESGLLGHVGCLLLARVVGKSPVEYLSEAEQRAARHLGVQWVMAPPASIDAAWDDVVAARGK